MNRQLAHWFEKFLVEVIAAAALAVGYFLLYPAVRDSDGQEAVSFLVAGGVRQIVIFAAAVVAMSAACAALAIRARPAATMVAALVGIAAVSVRSPQLRTLVWLQSGGLGAMFARLIVEVVVFGVILACAVIVAGRVRAAILAIRPGWGWRPPWHVPDDSQSPPATRLTGLGKVGQSLASAAVALFIGIAVVAVMLKSADRGQVIFSLSAAFALAVIIAYHVLPAPLVSVYFAAPLLAGVLFYALASVGSYDMSIPQGWVGLPWYARALPVDWLTAGGGGAAIGVWIGQRMRDERAMEALESRLKGT